MKNKKRDTDECNELVKVYEDYKKNEKSKLSLLVLSYNNIFSNNNISFNNYH